MFIIIFNYLFSNPSVPYIIYIYFGILSFLYYQMRFFLINKNNKAKGVIKEHPHSPDCTLHCNCFSCFTFFTTKYTSKTPSNHAIHFIGLTSIICLILYPSAIVLLMGHQFLLLSSLCLSWSLTIYALFLS